MRQKATGSYARRFVPEPTRARPFPEQMVAPMPGALLGNGLTWLMQCSARLLQCVTFYFYFLQDMVAAD